ncbi:MAG: undecaprenyl-diphosphate phosphatase [Coriobacteriia bacterium]|nr:undecaprenyl-diphosphate phosphatase [Coriobacteriia bacterium]
MELIELLKALLIGIVQGITEWLPISSTGHMILVDELVTLNVSEQFLGLFLVVIQLGSIMAVLVLYFHRLNPFSPRKDRPQKRATLTLWLKVIVACVPAAVVGLLWDSWVEEHFYNVVVVASALVLYGIAFIVIERLKRSTSRTQPRGKHAAHRLPVAADPTQELADLSFPRALAIGAFQCLALIPGTSRSGSTILGGLILGVSRQVAAEFSFFLAIPVMFGWSGLRAVKAFLIDKLTLTGTEWGVLVVGVIVAFIVSVFAIRFLMGFIKKHSFEVFGWYRIALGVLVLGFFALTGSLLG